MNFRERKQERTEYFMRYIFGWKIRNCGACSGSGRYDHDGSPKCGACEGTGKETYRGPKNLYYKNQT
jgi:DnaJ-class molecular chaperone